ncbi:hypothetical protein WS87_27775 [Burkholderia sp. MSMB0856]|uniref:hypothetical protein n=1 Tax=Burkholderia sp. MSMB0856 TaxID=1637869 RepID=UPI00075C6AEA|nr:hypothetical protein [Burkholderia sp. MSMB0856]AOJ90594.1 hypothetical protein WS87_27775 [Burkholderia sp. MSMB0856]KVH38410.1 hypothetical protein WS87_09215 [Burkholderia sp. MSMB0856]
MLTVEETGLWIVGTNKTTTIYRREAIAPGTTGDEPKETAMPIVNFELSLDRTPFESDHHVGKRITKDCDSGFTGLAGEVK